jgi:hypothetical protein
MYGMVKTTVYLPDDLKTALADVAVNRGVAEAQLIREAIASYVASAICPKPTPGLFSDGTFEADKMGEYMLGFGAH